jgi:L-lactate dehydrogenase complex protein LldF
MKAYRFGFSHPLLYELGGKFSSLATRTLAQAMGNEADQSVRLDNLPYPLSGWTETRDFPPFAPESFHDWWRKNRAQQD